MINHLKCAMHIWISCEIKSMKWNSVESFNYLLANIHTHTHAHRRTILNQSKAAVTGNNCNSGNGDWFDYNNSFVSLLSFSFTLFEMSSLGKICKNSSRHFKYANGTALEQSNNISLNLDKLWQIILIAISWKLNNFDFYYSTDDVATLLRAVPFCNVSNLRDSILWQMRYYNMQNK